MGKINLDERFPPLEFVVNGKEYKGEITVGFMRAILPGGDIAAMQKDPVEQSIHLAARLLGITEEEAKGFGFLKLRAIDKAVNDLLMKPTDEKEEAPENPSTQGPG